MLNTPQVSMGTETSWDPSITQLMNDTKTTASATIMTDTKDTVYVSSDLSNAIVRGDTLDNNPGFVNPRDLHQPNHSTQRNQNGHLMAGNEFSTSQSHLMQYQEHPEHSTTNVMHTHPEHNTTNIMHSDQAPPETQHIKLSNANTQQVINFQYDLYVKDNEIINYLIAHNMAVN